MDITFGKNNNDYGGIIIRSIKSLTNNKIIEGHYQYFSNGQILII
jgi:hypothetical protein